MCHGGVAIITCDSTTKTSPYSFPNPDMYEVWPISASVSFIKRIFFIIAAYIQPNYTVPTARGCVLYINNIILDIKNKNEDQFILLAGDFNQWKIEEAVQDYPDMMEISTPPTRNDRNINHIFVKWLDDLLDSGCIPPLESEELDGEGTRRYSDHRVQYAMARIEKKEQINWEVFSYRPFHEKGAAAFEAELRVVDWSEILCKIDTNSAANCIQHMMDDIMCRHFHLKTVKVKETDLPWINGTAHKRIRKKRAFFKAEARSEQWWKQRRLVGT